MTADRFEIAADAALLGTAKLAIPGAGFVLDVFKAIIGDNDARFRDVLISELHDHVNRLQGKVSDLEQELKAQGERLDELDPIALAHLVRDFMRDVSERPTAASRDAIVVATARQFDPRLGPFSMRQYWLQRIRMLSDIALEVLKLHSNGALYINALTGFYVRADINLLLKALSGNLDGCEKVSIPVPTASVYYATINDLGEAKPPLVGRINGQSTVETIGQLRPAGSGVLHCLGIDATWQEFKQIAVNFRSP